MNDQVSQMIPHLKTGSSYLFDHVRKGPFVAEFLGTKPAKDGDTDDVFLHVNIVTEDGSGQERLANTFMRDESGRKMRPPFEGRLIRPSLLTSISSPSSGDQRALTEKFMAIRAEAERKSVSGDLPVLSLPTEVAMKHLGEPASEEPGWLKKLFRRN